MPKLLKSQTGHLPIKVGLKPFLQVNATLSKRHLKRHFTQALRELENISHMRWIGGTYV